MPIPKWCDRKSIRTVKRGGASVLICCPKGKVRAGRCIVGTRAIEVRSTKLTKGTRIEHREHPEFPVKVARQIARDHLARNPKAYGAFAPKTDDPAGLPGAKINAELDRLSKEQSKLTEEFISAGRGYEKPTETWTKDDPLALRYKALSRRQADLRNEIERRYGPGAPSRLPRGFGPRK